MAENTRIEWANHTFNPWEGCQKVGPGCDHCYAEARDLRFHGGKHWGPGAPRRLTSDANWRKPLKWDRDAAAAGERPRVFCASLADVFDNAAPEGARPRLWTLIQQTPNLQWLLLTKRIGNVPGMLPADWDDGYDNVMLMITVVNQEEADRDIPKLLATRAKRRGLSMEPLLGPVDVTTAPTDGRAGWLCPLSGNHHLSPDHADHTGASVDWVIVGGESGLGARPMHPDWARSLRDQCVAAGVPYFFKQWGEWLPWEPEHGPCWVAQNGRSEDSHVLFPADLDRDESWDDGLWAIGEEIGHAAFQRVGKKAAGRLLDGREWSEMPA